MSGEDVHVLYVGGNCESGADVAAELKARRERLTVTSVDSADAAFECLTEADCIVCCHEPPATDGMAFLETVRERALQTPFVLFTDSGSESLASEAISAGADGYVPRGPHTDSVGVLAQRVESLVAGRRAETSYREVFEKSGVAMSIRDPETGAFVDANEQYCALMGYDREEIPSLTTSEVGIDEPPYTSERVHELLRETLREGPQTVEWVNERSDGTPVYVESTLKPATICGERRVLVSVQNVTERKERERMLRGLQHRTRDLMRAEMPQDIAAVAVETAEDVLDLPFSGVHLMEGRTLRGVAGTATVREQFGAVPSYRRDADDPIAEVVWEAYESGQTVLIEDLPAREGISAGDSPMRSGLIHPLGDHGVFITSATEPGAFADADAALAEMLATTTAAALDRAERQRRYDAIFNQTFQFTGLMEPDGTLIEANEAALEFVGLDREDVVGDLLWESPWFQYSDETREIARQSVERARDGEFFREEVTIVGADEIMMADYSVRPVTDDSGDVVLLVPEGRDITELKQREAELQRKNEQLEEFASVVSHDLQNPLSVAIGHLQLASEECNSDHLERVADAHDRMSSLIDDLLTLAREGESVDETDSVQLETMARGGWANVDTVAGELTVGGDITFEAHSGRIYQLFENLFRNAIEHGSTSADASVTVTVGPLYDGFYVADDGPGIPPDEREDVFEVGYSTSEEETGFGLRIVERVVTAHGWHIEVTESDAGGARFEITGVDPE